MLTTLPSPPATRLDASQDDPELPWDDVDVTSDDDVALDTLTPLAPVSGRRAAGSVKDA
jgi:hypothetical protein